MNKKYFIYLIQQNKRIITLLFLLGFAIVPVITAVNVARFTDYYHYSYDGSTMTFIVYLIILIGLTYLVPLFNYRFIQYKRSCDTFLSLPIKRKELFVTVTLFSLVEMYVPYILNVISGSIVLIAKGYPFHIINFVSYLVISLALVSVLYFANTFIVLKCNNTIDSIICMLGYSLLPVFIYFLRISFLDYYTFGLNDYYEFYWHQSIQSLIGHSCIFLMDSFSATSKEVFEFEWMAIYLFIGIALAAASSISFVKRKAEDSEQLTNSRWMYRLLIPAYTIICIGFFTIEEGIGNYIIYMIIIFIAYTIATFIANRQVKLSKLSIVLFITVMLITNVGGLVFEHTIAPKLSLAFPTNYDYMELNIYTSMGDYSLNSSYMEINNDAFVRQVQTLQHQLVEDHYNDIHYADYDTHLHVEYYDHNKHYIKSFYYPLSNAMAKQVYALVLNNHQKVHCYDYSKPDSKEYELTLHQLNKIFAGE